MKRFNIPSISISSSSSNISASPSSPNQSSTNTTTTSKPTIMSSLGPTTSSIRSSISIGSSFRKMNILQGLQSSESTTDGPRLSSVRSLFSHDENQNKVVEKKSSIHQDLNLILKILEDIRLQRPSYHSGLVVAYSSALLAPITYKGIKFTWYRQGNDSNQQFSVVDESYRSWYAPTVDDIGCKICVQCEDNFQQGFSRYVECDPISADPFLCSLAESSLKNSYYEALDVSVSMGLEEKDLVSSNDENSSIHSSEAGQTDINTPIHTVQDQITTLSTDSTAFLQFSGHSAVIVDSNGLFISIPVSKPETNSSNSTSQISNNGNGNSSSNATNTSNVSTNNQNKTGQKSLFRTSSRGLRIVPSESIKVHCSQPASLVLVVPIRTVTASSTKNQSTLTISEQIESSSDPSMESFLSSATLTIPWTYEGVHAPEVVADARDSNLSEQEREKRKREAEEDSINFANMVVSLAEFIASLPETTLEIKICISCSDRLQRDVLACSIRALICQPPGTTSNERLQILPWLSAETQIETDEGNRTVSDTVAIRNRLRLLEEENYTLKRERNELFEQIMTERETAVLREQALVKASSSGISAYPSTGSIDTNLSLVTAVTNPTSMLENMDKTIDTMKSENSLVLDTTLTNSINNSNTGTSVTTIAENADMSTSNSPKDQYRSIAAKVIELENKLSIANKRESEEVRFRLELEARNSQILQENDRLQKVIEDNMIQLTLIRHERDRSETRANHAKERLEALENKLQAMQREMTDYDKLRVYQQSQEDEIKSIVLRLEEKSLEAVTLINEKKLLQQELDDMKISIEKINQDYKHQLNELIQQRIRAEEERDLSIKQIALLSELNTKQSRDLESLPKLKESLQSAEANVNRLQGEINHLNHKSDSQAKDLKKALTESAVILSEYEKALVRKSEECNELQARVYELESRVSSSSISMSSASASSFLRGLSLPHAPSISMDPIRNMLSSTRSESSNMSVHSDTSQTNYGNNSDKMDDKYERNDLYERKDSISMIKRSGSVVAEDSSNNNGGINNETTKSSNEDSVDSVNAPAISSVQALAARARALGGSQTSSSSSNVLSSLLSRRGSVVEESSDVRTTEDDKSISLDMGEIYADNTFGVSREVSPSVAVVGNQKSEDTTNGLASSITSVLQSSLPSISPTDAAKKAVDNVKGFLSRLSTSSTSNENGEDMIADRSSSSSFSSLPFPSSSSSSSNNVLENGIKSVNQQQPKGFQSQSEHLQSREGRYSEL